MENNKTASVWLKITDGVHAGKLALQKRSNINQSFPYICQATWAGKVEPNEDIKYTIQRECSEELGDEFAKHFNFSELVFIGKNDFKKEKENWECYNYFGKGSEQLLKSIKMHQGALPELVFVSKNSKIYIIESGKDPKDNIVLFSDQYEILKKIINNNAY